MMMDNNFERHLVSIWTVRNTTRLPMNCLPLPAMLFGGMDCRRREFAGFRTYL